MKTISLAQINLLKIGNEIQLYGAIYSGNDQIFLIPLPEEDPDDLKTHEVAILTMDSADFARFLNQTDVLDVQGAKAILRKSQRQIDQSVSWSVYRRDEYACRYCGRADVPLTVDHVDLWEDGGASVEENLITACRRCNKLRGRVPYPEWVTSNDYRKVSKNLSYDVNELNQLVALAMSYLKTLRTKPRSR